MSENISLPESFIQILVSHIPESYKINEYGQIRTLTDIVKTLNEINKYKNLNILMNDFQAVLSQYEERGTISFNSLTLFSEIIKENENILFEKDILNIEHLEKIISNKTVIDNKIEKVFQKRGNTKLLSIIKYLNDKKKYTSSHQVIKDINFLFKQKNVLNDCFFYPLYFFEHGLNSLWRELTINGILSNDLLEKIMFTNHLEKINLYGLNKVIQMDYRNDGFCHLDIYFPRKSGIGPIYVKQENGLFVKSCGNGKSPIDYYEQNLLELLNDSDL